MMTVRELIDDLEAVAHRLGDQTPVVLVVHDGPVDRDNTPKGRWFALPVEAIGAPDPDWWDGQSVPIFAEA